MLDWGVLEGNTEALRLAIVSAEAVAAQQSADSRCLSGEYDADSALDRAVDAADAARVSVLGARITSMEDMAAVAINAFVVADVLAACEVTGFAETLRAALARMAAWACNQAGIDPEKLAGSGNGKLLYEAAAD